MPRAFRTFIFYQLGVVLSGTWPRWTCGSHGKSASRYPRHYFAITCRSEEIRKQPAWFTSFGLINGRDIGASVPVFSFQPDTVDAALFSPRARMRCSRAG